MMTKALDVYQYIDSFAPFNHAMDFDNPGLLVGDGSEKVSTAILALDITPGVIEEAKQKGAQLIISHHPVIFTPLKKLIPGTAPYELVRNGIAAICAHTNLDMAHGGVNDCLADRLELTNIRTLKEYAPGFREALMGDLKIPMAPFEFAKFVKESLHADGLRYTKGDKLIHTVGLCSGGGIDLLETAMQMGCDAFVTGESKHNFLVEANSYHYTLIDAGHFFTEDVVIEPLRKKLETRFPEVCWIKSVVMKSPAFYL
ncbi:Nif3-like dinuclear metal center hexameric protein [Caproicibacterium sp. NSD3]